MAGLPDAVSKQQVRGSLGVGRHCEQDSQSRSPTSGSSNYCSGPTPVGA